MRKNLAAKKSEPKDLSYRPLRSARLIPEEDNPEAVSLAIMLHIPDKEQLIHDALETELDKLSEVNTDDLDRVFDDIVKLPDIDATKSSPNSSPMTSPTLVSSKTTE